MTDSSTPDPTHKEAINYVDSRTPEERERDNKIKVTMTTSSMEPTIVDFNKKTTEFSDTHKGVFEKNRQEYLKKPATLKDIEVAINDLISNINNYRSELTQMDTYKIYPDEN